MKRKILYISGTRADYGLMRSVLRSIYNHPDLSLDIVVTGMHLMEEFGNTLEEIKEDEFRYHIIDVQNKDDTKEAMAIFIGKFIQELVPVVHHLQPDIILVLGDRGEMLAGAIAGVYMSIPVAHIHGGEITSTADDYARHAITKLAQIHLPATDKSRDRIIQMGEDASRIFVVGAPGLDQILNEPLFSQEELARKYQIDFSKPVLLVVQHPVTLEMDSAPEQIRETLEAVASLQIQTIVIYPNADAGGRGMIEMIKKYEHIPFIRTYKSLNHKEYLSLLKNVDVLMGNSSSGIIEAPSFGIPVINIGSRQHGRQRSVNVIDVGYNRHDIVEGIDFALHNKEFRANNKNKINPYGDGHSAEKIVEILSTISIDKLLLQKTK